MKGKGEEKEEEEAECGREEMGETQESTEERCKGCKAGWPRLLGFARRFAYRFSCATVSYDGKRRAISLNFVEGTSYDISLVATFKHACFTPI